MLLLLLVLLLLLASSMLVSPSCRGNLPGERRCAAAKGAAAKWAATSNISSWQVDQGAARLLRFDRSTQLAMLWKGLGHSLWLLVVGRLAAAAASRLRLQPLLCLLLRPPHAQSSGSGADGKGSEEWNQH
jgi:hypothetical protein